MPKPPKKELDPLYRLEYAVLAFKALSDLLAEAGDRNSIRGSELSVLISLLVEELERCSEELRDR
jgi:hypothetical protein